MPTIASVLDPKLSALQTKIAGIQAKLQAEGAYPGLSHELAEVADEATQVSTLAKLLVLEVRGFQK